MPRQLDPDPEILDKLTAYVADELINHRAEREHLLDRWNRELQDFWAEPSVESPELPVTGFASIIVPLTAIAVEAVHARDMGQLFGLKELVTVDVTEQYQDVKQGLEKYFNHEFLNTLSFRSKVEAPLLQMTKNGTGIMTVGYREVKSSVVRTADGNEIKVPVYREKGTTIDGVDISDFVMPFYATEIDQAPWVGHTFRISEYTLKQMVAASQLASDAYEKLNGYYIGVSITNNKVEAEVQELTNTVPVYPSEIELTRVLLDFDVDGNGEESAIEVIFHENSRQILSLTYSEGRDYEKGVYMPMEYRWYGYGIAKQNNQFQEEVTAQHRQRLDNATIANMAMFKVKKTASWIKDDEPIFPGKKWFVEDMEDIQPMFIGDVKASAYNNENQVVIYSQQRTGVNELTLGMPNIGTPGTASDSLARVQESNRKFDYTYNNKKDFLNRVLWRAAQSIIKYGPADRQVFSILPQGAEVQIYLQDIERLKNKMFFNVQLAGAKNNKVLDRNTYTQLAGMQTQYWTQVMGLAQQLQDPNLVQEMAKAALRAADQINLEILRAFDVPNPEKLIFNFDAYRPTQIPAGVPSAQPAAPQGANAAPPSGITSVLAPNARIETPNVIAQGGLPPGLSLAG
jgi:hypothetical protein